MARILITGSARGIGLELVSQYHAAGHEVIAVCRDPGADLPALGVQCIEGVELADAAGLERVRNGLGTRILDVLIHNAGVLREDRLGGLRAQADDLRAI